MSRTLSGKLRQQVYDRDGGLCQLCGKAMPFWRETSYGRGMISCDIDHIVPRSKGGSNDLENLRLTCPSCNRRRRR